MENINDNSSRGYAAALVALIFLSGCASVSAAGTTKEAQTSRETLQGQCPFVAGRYYNFPEIASASIFSNAGHDSVSCADNEFCTLSRIFDEETGYHAVVELEQPEPGTIIFRRGQDVVTKTMASGDFICAGGSITLSESEPGEQDSVRHLAQISPDMDGALIARVGVFTSGPEMEIRGPAPLVFSGSAWLRFEAVDDRNRKDWNDPVAIREYLGSTYAGASAPTLGATWDQLCVAVNRDRIASTMHKAEYAWWYQETVWEFSETWSNSLRQALHAHGIRPDNTMAYMWLELAGKEYQRFLGKGSFTLDTSIAKQTLAESMTPSDINIAEQLASNWSPADCSDGDEQQNIAGSSQMIDEGLPMLAYQERPILLQADINGFSQSGIFE